MKKSVFIGKLPEPIGGVTTFNQRRFKQLKSIDEEFILVEPIYKNLFKLIFFLNSSKTIHLSVQNPKIIILCSLISPNDSVIFYDHNTSRHFIHFNKFRRKFYDFFFKKKCKNIVLVNEHLDKHYEVFESYDDLQSKFSVLSAFIPPTDSELDSIVNSYNKNLYRIYQNSLISKTRNVILTSAFQPNLDKEGKDIYSLDKMIDIFKELSPLYPNYNFIIAVASYNDSDFSNYIKNKINQLKDSEPNLIFIESNTTIWPIFKITKLFIRATTTDGDSVSIREAIYFDAPVLASNSVSRPKEVILFDIEDDNLKKIICNII